MVLDLAFLTTLDEATGLEEGECERADSFRFVLDVRALEEAKEAAEAESMAVALNIGTRAHSNSKERHKFS